MGVDLRSDSTDYRMELISPMRLEASIALMDRHQEAWKLDLDDFQVPKGPKDPPLLSRWLLKSHGNKSRVAKYYKKQEKIVADFSEMDTIHEIGTLAGAPTEDELKELAKTERMAIMMSNIANLILFALKVFASIESKSLAVIASTFDSLLDILSGFILWFTSHFMKKPNQYRYPIGKQRMQPLGITVFASIMGTLGLQILLVSAEQLMSKSHPNLADGNENWMIGIMVTATVVKFVLMIYCRTFKNGIVRAYAQDHFFDVITNSIGLSTALVAIRSYWWIDPIGAIMIALYTIFSWSKTVMQNVYSLIGRTAPPDFLAKLTYLIWNHHKEIKYIATVRAYTFGTFYFAEVDIIMSGNIHLSQAHDIGETLQEKIEKLPEVERAFVHVDFEHGHKPVTVHKVKV